MAIELATKKLPKEKPDAKQPVTNEIALVGVYDRFSSYPSRGLTPEKLATILQEADSGNIYRQMELFEEMLEKDSRMSALFMARRLAVTGKNYNIIPASDNPKDVEIAQDVERMINRIKSWNNTVSDMLDCVPKGFSALELFWESRSSKWEITRTKWRHQKKFRFGKVSDANSDTEELRLIIESKHADVLRGIVPDLDLSRSATDGISLNEAPGLRRRFAISLCKARSGSAARTSLLRPLTYLYLFKNYDVKWWVQFAEMMLGYRIGKYDANQPDQKKLLEEALAGLASDSAALISKDSEIEFVEMFQKAASHQVYSDLKNWVNQEYAVLILGHTGSAEGTPGKLGSEDLAREVRSELVESDARVIDEAITDDIIIPYIDYNHGQQDEYPYYQTDVSESPNLLEEVQLDKGLQALGFPITKKYVKEKYGRPLPDPNDTEDEVLKPALVQSIFSQGQDGQPVVGDGKKKLLTSL